MGSSNLTKNVCKDGKTPKIRGTKKMRLYMAYYMEVLRISKGFGEIGWRLRKSVVWLSPLKMKKRCCRRIYRSRSGSFPSQYAGVAQLVEQLIRKNQVCDSKSEYANVAQSVEQLIRNQQVVCSSHIISSKRHWKRCFSMPFCCKMPKMVEVRICENVWINWKCSGEADCAFLQGFLLLCGLQSKDLCMKLPVGCTVSSCFYRAA